MALAKAIFWGCLFLVVYTYFLYPMLLFLAYSAAQARRDLRYLFGRDNRRRSLTAPDRLPGVTLLISAYNEEKHLPDKIANIRQLDYPADRLEVIFVSDGSTDRTDEILRSLLDANVQKIFLSDRKGKANALNHAVAAAQNEILIFSDAATLFAPDSLKAMIRHFSNPRVGAVCGALRFENTAESKQTEGAYWRYEGMLRLMEARLGATLTASGAIYALRRQCFRPLPPGTVLEDFLIPMNARKQGFRVLYDPEATATDFAAPNVAGEFARRVRLAVGSYKAIGELLATPLPGFAMVAFVSHKLLRWIVGFLLVGLLVSNVFLVGSPFYRVLLIGQLLFYAWAVFGYLFRQRMQHSRFGLVGYFLVAMNLAFLVGFVRFLLGREEATWQRVS